MSWHEVWHVLVLASTVLGAGCGVILVLGPLVFETYPQGLRRSRALLVGVVVLGLVLLVVEWLIVH
jgi:hypothetical protein